MWPHTNNNKNSYPLLKPWNPKSWFTGERPVIWAKGPSLFSINKPNTRENEASLPSSTASEAQLSGHSSQQDFGKRKLSLDEETTESDLQVNGLALPSLGARKFKNMTKVQVQIGSLEFPCYSVSFVSPWDQWAGQLNLSDEKTHLLQVPFL